MIKMYAVFYVDIKEGYKLVSALTSFTSEKDAIDSIKGRFNHKIANHTRYLVLPVYEEAQ